MPNDSLGVKKCYPDATLHAKYFAFPNGHWIGDTPTKNGDFYHIGGGQVRFAIIPAGSTGCEKGIADHAKTLSQGFMCSADDWRHFEATWYIKHGSGSDEYTVYGRGGTHSDSCPCCGFAYKMALTTAGGIKFAKETWHVHYDFFNMSGSATGSLSGREVGMKYVCYDDGHVVTNECWLDVDNNNTWVKKYTFVDNGKGSGGTNCKSSSDSQVGLWGGPELTFRSDGLTYDCRKISGREINPTGTFTDDAPPGGGGTGGTTPPGTLVRKKYAIAAVAESGHAGTDVPDYAKDGNLATKWTSNTSATATLTFDLGAQGKVDDVKISFYNGNTIKYFFSIQYSLDGVTYTTKGTTSSSTTPTTGGGGSASGIAKDHGNLVVSGPKIKMIYWGDTWATTENPTKAQIDQKMQDLIASPYFSKLIQYRGILRPTWGGGTIYSGTNPPATFTIEDAKAPIEALMNANTIPKPSADPNVIYMVVTKSTSTLAGGVAGMHTIVDYSGAGAGIIYYGALHNFPTLNEDTRVLSEEIVESMTSPGSVGLEGFLIDPGIGHNMNPAYPANQYTEINDVCSTTSGVVNGVAVFPYYSNMDTACVIPTTDYSPTNPSSGMQDFSFTEITARFIRLLCQGNNQGTGTAVTENITRINEVEIWGRQPGDGTGGGTTGGGGGTGTDPGDTGTPGSTPAAPPPVTTVYKDFTDSYHLAVETGDLCGLGQAPPSNSLETIYKVPVGNTMYLRLAMPADACVGADAMVGEQIATDACELIGKIPRAISATFKRTGTCDGYLMARIWDKDFNVCQDLGSYPALAVSFGNDQTITFVNMAANYALKKGDIIGIEYDDPSSNCDNYIAYRHADSNAADAMNAIFCKFRTALITDANTDLAAEIWV